MTKAIKKWWDDNARTFQKEHKIPLDISYGPWMPNEDRLKLMGNLKGKKVLEIGCGGAQCGITFAKKGAEVIGIDISREQLKYAEELAKNNRVKVRLLQGDITSLPKIKSNSQDIVFSSWAMFYIGNLKKCFKEVYRVLKKGGVFIFSTHHPFWESIDKETMKVKRCYFDLGGYYKELHKVGMFGAYRHNITEFTEALFNAGFKIERILEPDARKYKKYSTEHVFPAYKRRAMMKIPRTIIFKAIKI